MAGVVWFRIGNVSGGIPLPNVGAGDDTESRYRLGWQLGVKEGNVFSGSPNHPWVLASFIVVGVMAILALGLLEPANIAVLIELKKPRPRPQVIEQLMKRFIYCAAILGLMQVATLVIMTKLASS